MGDVEKLICVVGMPGAGKSIVSKTLAEYFNTEVILMGDVVRAEARRRGIGKDLKSMMKFAEELRKKYGKAAVAKLTINHLKRLKINKNIIIIDGVRSLDEINEFRRHFKHVIIVAVHTSPRRRFQRLQSRGRPDDPKTWEEFQLRDKKELEFGIGSAIALADIMIVNEDKDVNELIKEVRTIASRLG